MAVDPSHSIQMNRKELTGAFMMILLKKTFGAHGLCKIISALKGLNQVYVEGRVSVQVAPLDHKVTPL